MDDSPGSPIPLSGARLRVLLAALLLRANLPVSSDALADSAAATRALALWRGAPLLDVASQALHAEFAPHLDQLHVQALEDRTEADLHLCLHDSLVPQLRELTAHHPYASASTLS